MLHLCPVCSLQLSLLYEEPGSSLESQMLLCDGPQDSPMESIACMDVLFHELSATVFMH